MKKYAVNMVRQSNLTKRVLVGQAIHIAETFHLRNINFTHHMLGKTME